MKTSIRLSAVLSLLCVTSSSVAAESAPDCAGDAACLALSDQAKEQSSIGNLDEAFRLYKLAYEVRADPRLFYNLARVLHKQGNTTDAAQFYRKFLTSSLSDIEQKRRAQEYLDEILTPPAGAPHSGPVQTDAILLGKDLNSTAAPANKSHQYYKGGWIASISVASTLVAASIPFWYFATLEGQTNCGAEVPRNQCPQIYQGAFTVAAPLLAVGLAHIIPFGILLYFDRKEHHRAALILTPVIGKSR